MTKDSKPFHLLSLPATPALHPCWCSLGHNTTVNSMQVGPFASTFITRGRGWPGKPQRDLRFPCYKHMTNTEPNTMSDGMKNDHKLKHIRAFLPLQLRVVHSTESTCPIPGERNFQRNSGDVTTESVLRKGQSMREPWLQY